MRKLVDLGFYINPDEIAASLEGSYDDRVRAAQMRAEELRQDCLDRRIDFCFESVFSHPAKLDVMRAARRSGYEIIVFFVSTEDPRVNVQRVALRVAEGGHDVPRDKITARWERVMRLLPEIVALADKTYIFDNSVTGPGANIRRVAFAQSEGNRVTIHRSPDGPKWLGVYLPFDSLSVLPPN